MDDFPITLRLFGPFSYLSHGQPLPRLRSRKGHWVLALLALRHGKPVERSWLAGTLWPESSESQALYNLRITLTDLRHALGENAYRLLSASRHTLAFDFSGVDSDLISFDEAIRQGDLAAMERAISLYQGRLLEGCTEEWVFQERHIREQQYLQALERLAEHAKNRGDLAQSCYYLRQIIQVDPLREAAHRTLMEALALEGSFSAAIQVFRELRDSLYRNMHMEPAPETQQLFQKIRLEARRLAEAAPPSPSVSPSPSPRRLPHFLTRLVGREKEVESVSSLMNASRLVTLTGPGGIGKTRLAVRVAEEVQERYPDGVWFVDLAPLTDAGRVALAVAQCLGLRPTRQVPPEENLVSVLEAQSTLLVLDNCEHVAPACASLVESLVRHCPRLRILATSRHALGVSGEIVYRTLPLSLPISGEILRQSEDPVSLLMQSSAAQFFVERASSVLSTFTLRDRTAYAVAQICERLEGLPLAIELTVSRLKVLTAEQIAERLQGRLHMLTGNTSTGVPRHQTLWATLDWSYSLLSPVERSLLRQLSIFSGRFSLEAAEAVCCLQGELGVLEGIESLIDKSLIQSVETGAERHRFGLLIPLREFASEQLSKEERDALRCRHASYYQSLVEEIEPKLAGAEQKHWLDYLEAEHENIRMALGWGLEHNRVLLLRIAGALWRFWMSRGNLEEGRRWLDQGLHALSIEAATEHDSSLLEVQAASAKAHFSAAVLAHLQADNESALASAHESLAAYQTVEDRWNLCFLLGYLGDIVDAQGEHANAISWYEDGIALSREVGNLGGMAYALSGLGRLLADAQHEMDRAVTLLEESLKLYRHLGDHHHVSMVLWHLGHIAMNRQEYEKAAALFEEDLRLTRQIGDLRHIAVSLTNSGLLEQLRGQYPQARAYFEEGLKLHERLGLKQEAGTVRCYLGHVALAEQQTELALLHFTQSLNILQHLDDGERTRMFDALVSLGKIFTARGDYLRAKDYLFQGLEFAYELSCAQFIPAGRKRLIPAALEAYAMLAAAQEEYEWTARLIGAARAIRQALDLPLSCPDELVLDSYLAQVREATGEQGLASALLSGQAMRLPEIIASIRNAGEPQIAGYAGSGHNSGEIDFLPKSEEVRTGQ